MTAAFDYVKGAVRHRNGDALTHSDRGKSIFVAQEQLGRLFNPAELLRINVCGSIL
jgi:hypothetical protein